MIEGPADRALRLEFEPVICALRRYLPKRFRMTANLAFFCMPCSTIPSESVALGPASMPRSARSSYAASMSETISPPSAEPGAAVVSPWPNVTGAPEPGGSELDDAKAVQRRVVAVEPPAQTLVELLGSVDVGHRDDLDLEVHVDLRGGRGAAVGVPRQHRGITFPPVQHWTVGETIPPEPQAAQAAGSVAIDTERTAVPPGRTSPATLGVPRGNSSCEQWETPPSVRNIADFQPAGLTVGYQPNTRRRISRR